MRHPEKALRTRTADVFELDSLSCVNPLRCFDEHFAVEDVKRRLVHPFRFVFASLPQFTENRRSSSAKQLAAGNTPNLVGIVFFIDFRSPDGALSALVEPFSPAHPV